MGQHVGMACFVGNGYSAFMRYGYQFHQQLRAGVRRSDEALGLRIMSKHTTSRSSGGRWNPWTHRNDVTGSATSGILAKAHRVFIILKLDFPWLKKQRDAPQRKAASSSW